MSTEDGYKVWFEFVGSLKQPKKFAAAVVVTRGDKKALMCEILDSANDAPWEQAWRGIDWLVKKLEPKKCPIQIMTHDYELASVINAAQEKSVIAIGALQKFYDMMEKHPEYTVAYSKETDDFDRYIEAFRVASEALSAAKLR